MIKLGSQNTREWTDISKLPRMGSKVKRGYVAVNRKGDLKYIKTDKPVGRVSTSSQGYKTYHWERKGKSHSIQLHRLVAMAYCDGYAKGLVVDHKDTNRINNSWDNLLWVTSEQNANNPRTLKKLRIARTQGSTRVTAYFFDGTPFRTFTSLKEAARMLNIPKLTLQETAIKREGVKHCYGLLWKSTPCVTTPRTLSRKECEYGKYVPVFMAVTSPDGKQYFSRFSDAAAHMGVGAKKVKEALDSGKDCNGCSVSAITCREYWQARNPEMFL